MAEIVTVPQGGYVCSDTSVAYVEHATASG
jgi:hypothetical protein